MYKINYQSITGRSFIAVSIIALMFAYFPSVVSAAAINARRVTIGSSAPSAVTTYSFTFTVPSTTVLQSASFTACTTASGACGLPTGFSVTGTTLTAQPTNLGDATGWTVNTATPGSLRLAKTGNVAAPTGNQTVGFTGVTNPSATNATFFMRIATFSDASWTTTIDNGTVAASTATQIQVALAVDEALTFCTGTSITGQNCGTVAGSTVNLGTGSTTVTTSGTSVMAASTNGASGYTITVNGATLTSGGNTITALAAGGASTTGTEQFGLNLVSNATPAVGAARTGTGSAAALGNYATANSFRFVTGESVASVAGPTNANTFTVSYIANIEGLTEAGAYTSNLNYIATANF